MDEWLITKLDELNVWKRAGERAPHKPLLVLLALGVFQNGERKLAFVKYEKKLQDLLREFGPSRSSHHAEYPFWRLQGDGLWVVTADGPMQNRRSSNNPTVRELREKNAIGSFPDVLVAAMTEQPLLITEIASKVLADHFPPSIHSDILDAVGLSLERGVDLKKVRSPEFRLKVLRAYEYRCSVCGLDLRINNMTVALEAAHIRWHVAGGPDVEANGLALCSLHHKLFDLGAFTINAKGEILVSTQVHGGHAFEEVLLIHHGARCIKPLDPDHAPRSVYLDWHRTEVFKEPARILDDRKRRR